MEPRIDTHTPEYQAEMKPLLGVENFLHGCGLETPLMELLRLRVSQINGCAYCLDMHWKDLRALGESEQRLYGLDAWEESPYYSARERAALRWAEAVTNLREGHVPDGVYAAVRSEFTEREIVHLTMAVGMINFWNRLAIPLRTVPGGYVSRYLPAPATTEASS